MSALRSREERLAALVWEYLDPEPRMGGYSTRIRGKMMIPNDVVEALAVRDQRVDDERLEEFIGGCMRAYDSVEDGEAFDTAAHNAVVLRENMEAFGIPIDLETLAACMVGALIAAKVEGEDTQPNADFWFACIHLMREGPE